MPHYVSKGISVDILENKVMVCFDSEKDREILEENRFKNKMF